MKENAYRNLAQHIPVPAGLNERVLRAARQRSLARRAPSRAVQRRRFLPRLVCATCALALVLGALYLRPARPEQNAVSPSGQAGLPAVSAYTFGIAAYAAETGKTTPMLGGKLAIGTGSGMSSAELGHYTGSLFRITGDNIQTVSASIDRGGFYKQITRSNLSEAEMAELQQAQDQGSIAPTSLIRTDDGVWYLDEMNALGNTFTEDYDPTISYGFWVPPTELPAYSGDDLREEAHQSIDTFEGAVLTLTVTFTDGTTQTQTLTLHTDRLKVVYEENGTQTLLPEVVSSEEPYLYGIYAEGTTPQEH